MLSFSLSILPSSHVKNNIFASKLLQLLTVGGLGGKSLYPLCVRLCTCVRICICMYLPRSQNTNKSMGLWGFISLGLTFRGWEHGSTSYV